MKKTNNTTINSTLCCLNTMPRQNKAASAAASPDGAGTGGKKRDAKAEYIALMTWLSNCDNRNIISGAAGSAQNNGGMNSSKLVVSKAQGHVIPLCCFRLHTLTLNRWGMLAKALSEKTGGTFDSSQAENKYRYYEQKYHKAKLASQVSGFGVDNADREKGIQNIDQKMESLCASYFLWDSWFGSTQKYAPASVLVGGLPGEDEAGDEVEADANPMRRDDPEAPEAVPQVDAVSGGVDGARDDAARTEAAATDVQSASSGGRQGKAAVGGKSGPAAGALVGAQQNLMSIVAKSPTSASVGSSGKSSSSSNFDQVYASVQAAKSAQMQLPCLIRIYSLRLYAAQAQVEIARRHNEAASETQTRGFNHDEQKQTREFGFQRELESRKFAFEAEAKALELAVSRSDQQADRNVRQRIEFERNVTQLLTTDPTGKLAKDLVSVIDDRFGPLQRSDQHDPVANLLERFMNKYG